MNRLTNAAIADLFYQIIGQFSQSKNFKDFGGILTVLTMLSTIYDAKDSGILTQIKSNSKEFDELFKLLSEFVNKFDGIDMENTKSEPEDLKSKIESAIKNNQELSESDLNDFLDGRLFEE